MCYATTRHVPQILSLANKLKAATELRTTATDLFHTPLGNYRNLFTSNGWLFSAQAFVKFVPETDVIFCGCFQERQI